MNRNQATRSKSKLSTSGNKTGWTPNKDIELDPGIEVSGEEGSISNPITIHSTEFLETLNLKSKGNVTEISNDFSPQNASLSISTLSKLEDNENDSVLENPDKPSVHPAKQGTNESQYSLGKTLSFSLQLIASGDSTAVSPVLIPRDINSSPLAHLSPNETKSEILDVETVDEPAVLKDISTPIRTRYMTRSSLSNNDHRADLKVNEQQDTHQGSASNKRQESKINKPPNPIVIEIDNPELATESSQDLKNVNNPDEKMDTDVGQSVVPSRKRGRRKKEDMTYAVTKENVFVCSQCGKTFNKSQTLRQHFITHTNRFACTFCDVCCKSKGDLRSHIQTHTKEKPFQCEVCCTFYTRESILKKHKQTQIHKNACFQLGNQIQKALKADLTPNNARKVKLGKFSCSHCSQKCVSKYKLNQHLKVHSYRYACPYCFKRCKTALMLKIHKRCHLRSNTIPCRFCCSVFSNNKLLRQHIRTAHSFAYWRNKFPGTLWQSLLAQKVECISDLKAELKSIKSGGQFACNVCSRIFKSKKAFEKHCKKHPENLPSSAPENKLLDQSTASKMPKYHCSECTKSFTNFDEFSKHHKDLHSEKSMTCHICYNQFDHPAEFKSHVLNHVPTMLFSGASLEESKIPSVHRRYKRSNLHKPYSLSSSVKKNALKEENIPDEDDEQFLESNDFLQFLSTAFNDDSDDEREEEEDSCDDDDLYNGLKMLIYDSDEDCSAVAEKPTVDKQDNPTTAKKKPDINMKMFCIQDDENNFYKCTPCNTLFITSAQLKDHMESHVCTQCNIFCQNKDELSEHFHCQEKESQVDDQKNDQEKTSLDDMSDLQSDDVAFTSDDEMNEVFLDELEGILDCDNKAAPSVDFLNTFSHDEIIKTNKKIFERYSCIDVPTNIYACIICKRKYARPTTLTRHFKTHVCHYCNTFFVDKSDLNDHKYKHKKKAAMIKAEISGEAATKALRSPLVSKVNRELFKKFTIVDTSRNINKCCLCDKLFVRKTVLTRHMKTHVCSYCDKFYEDKYELARHVSMHKMDPHIPEDESVQRQYPVFDSEKPFDPRTAFSNPLEDEESKMVAMGSSYSSSLPQFTTTFSTPSTNSNETVTFIQIPVSETCTDPNAVTFGPGVAADAPTTYQILSDPIVQSQGSYIVAPQNCHGDEANKMLALTQDHLLPGNRLPVETPDLYECNICSKTFFKSGHLKSHISTHAAPAPFACRYCGKTFVRNGPLRKHEKTHDVKRCDHCDMSFTCQFELDHHMQIHETYPFYK